MISRTTSDFWHTYKRLPADVKQQARAAYTRFMHDPNHTSLRFRQVHPVKPIYSVRIGGHYRALGLRKDNGIIWFWIGSHAEYDKLLKRF